MKDMQDDPFKFAPLVDERSVKNRRGPPKSRSPDFHLHAMNTETNERSGKIGAGWKNDNGSVSIRLDEGVCIQHQRGVIFTLFPPKEKDIEREERLKEEVTLGISKNPFDQRKRW